MLSNLMSKVYEGKILLDYMDEYDAFLPSNSAFVKACDEANIDVSQLESVYNISQVIANHLFPKGSTFSGKLTALSGNTFTFHEAHVEDESGKIYDILDGELQDILMFPVKETVLLNDMKAYDGYTLFSTFGSDVTHLVDNEGKVKHQWIGTNPGMPFQKLITSGQRKGQLIRHLNNNRTSRAEPRMNFGGVRGLVEILDFDSNIIWSYTYYGEKEITDEKYGTKSRHVASHHDFVYNEANDSIFIMVWVSYNKEESLNDGRPEGLFKKTDDTTHIAHEMIIEVKIDTSEIIWSWNSHDHIGAGPDKINMGYYLYEDKEDIFHANGLDFNPERKELMLSVRHFDEIWVIDYESGAITWRWGNSTTYSEDGVKILDGQHNCEWIKEEGIHKGAIMLFDNDYQTEKHSEVRIIYPRMFNDQYTIIDGKYGPEYQQYSVKINPQVGSWFISGCQMLPNGNILTCNGPYGTIIEFDSNNNEVWRYSSPIEGFISFPRPKDPSEDFIVNDGTNYRESMTFRALKYSCNLPMFKRINSYDLPLSTLHTHALSMYYVVKYRYPFMFDLLNKYELTHYLSNPHANCMLVVNKETFENLMNRLACVYKNASLIIKYAHSTQEVYNLFDMKNILLQNIFHHTRQLKEGSNRSQAKGRTDEMISVTKDRNTLTGWYNLKYTILNECVCMNGTLYELDNIVVPELPTTGVISYDESRASDELVLFNIQNTKRTYAMHKNGTIVKNWITNLNVGNTCPAYIQSGPLRGLLLRCGLSESLINVKNVDDVYMSGGAYDTIQLITRDNDVVFETQIADPLFMHHDAFVNESTGTIYVIANENKTYSEATEKGFDVTKPMFSSSRFVSLGCASPVIIEIKPIIKEEEISSEYTVEYTWKMWDHIKQNMNVGLPNYSSNMHQNDVDVNNHPYNDVHGPDFFHINSIAVRNDKMLISCRNTSEMMMIDKRSGNITWKYCKPSLVLGQHDPQFLNDYIISFYNNGWGIESKNHKIECSAMILNTKNNSFIKKYPLVYGLDSNYQSGCRETNNKNMFICSSLSGCMLEMDGNNEIVWKFVNPFDKYGKTVLHSVDINQNDNRIFKASLLPKQTFDELNINVLDEKDYENSDTGIDY